MAHQGERLKLSFTSVLSHEMLTPLSAILQYSEQCRNCRPERLPPLEALQEAQTAIHDNALRLQHLLENFLLYARLQTLLSADEAPADGEWTARAELCPGPLIAEWGRLKAGKAGRADDVSLTLDENACFAGSQVSLWKMVDEVLDNAFKFSEPGTPVRIVSVRAHRAWRLEISDRGRGISREQLVRIGAFVQFDRQRYEQQGVGLGLAIVHLLARLQGGACSITSVPGQGTSVTLTFPEHSPVET